MSEETINYLVYDTEADAIARADVEGARRGYAYHNTPDGVSRYHTYPQETADNKYALDVTEYQLTDDETAAIVTDVTFPTEEE
tara:strand:- start:377 stop:625 length:249 start_codon:yes stop_codon:yes gene_type:complete